jgi:alpha-galactosidase
LLIAKKRQCFHIIAISLLFFTASTLYATEIDLSVVFIGNSITRHGPAPAIGWTGNWGMAASEMSKDYVWQTVKQLPIKSVQTFTIVDLEKKPKTMRLPEKMLASARKSQLVVVQLGDNVGANALADFNRAYSRLLADAKPEKGVLICLSTWYRSTAVDAVTENACKHAGGSYIQIGDIPRKPNHDASAQKISNAGVRSHPGDIGMAEIAKRIVALWKKKYPSAEASLDKSAFSK